MRQAWEMSPTHYNIYSHYNIYRYVEGILMFLSYGIPLDGVFKIQKIQGW